MEKLDNKFIGHKLLILQFGIVLICICLCFMECRSDQQKAKVLPNNITKVLNNVKQDSFDYDTLIWKELLPEDGFILDLKYATEDNFTKQKIYDCGRCFLKKEMAKKLVKIQKYLNNEKAYSLKLFDCYRPISVQRKLWKIMPNPSYVAHPDKVSMHNKGLAIDLTIVDENSKDLEMGTEFDFFGKRAHTDFLDLPDHILSNRKLLKSIMLNEGIKGIRTEWWHYSLRTLESKGEDWNWFCKN